MLLRGGAPVGLDKRPEAVMRDGKWDQWLELLRRGVFAQDFTCLLLRPMYWLALLLGRQYHSDWAEADAERLLPKIHGEIKKRGPQFQPHSSDPRAEFWQWLLQIIHDIVREAEREESP